ncbi:hypothetical protein NKH77_55645 [Streptomyces sp. M19]
MDVGMDVLQFRDHVMTHEECADRLRHDIRLAKSLGFTHVRVLSVVPVDILVSALPLAESLDIRLGKEIHQPMNLEGREVGDILDVVERTGTEHLGIVPDLGIFQFRPSEVLLAWLERRGASPRRPRRPWTWPCASARTRPLRHHGDPPPHRGQPALRLQPVRLHRRV